MFLRICQDGSLFLSVSTVALRMQLSIPEKRMTLHVYGVYIVLSFLILQYTVHNGHFYLYETIYQVWDNGRNKVKLFTIKIREINIFCSS